MPHLRTRSGLVTLLKRLEFSPVVAIQGARQTGKSVLARELLTSQMKSAKYLTLDDKTQQTFAQESPQTFLSSAVDSGVKTLIIDEAQKSPALFDAIKYQVDLNRVPGRFLLLGSTEFSLLQNIRESLTGRISRIRLFPMTFHEVRGLEKASKPISRAETLKYLSVGGMPAIAFVRDPGVRDQFFQDWIDLTVQRDIHQFKRLKLESDLADSILRQTCVLEEPTAAAIAKATRANHKKVGTHLKALCELFVITAIQPHPSGTGKTIYLPLDSGIASYLGASRERQLHVALMNERMADESYSNQRKKKFYYYRSSGKKMIHWVEEEAPGKIHAFQIFDRESIKKPDLELLKAFLVKNSGARATLLAPIQGRTVHAAVSVQPWEVIWG